jgi:hypothetical protein
MGIKLEMGSDALEFFREVFQLVFSFALGIELISMG